jgi:hypothetical protein
MKYICLMIVSFAALVSPASAQEHQIVTFVDTALPDMVDVVDIAPAGPSVGDMYSRQGHVRFEPEGPVVGEYYTQATIIRLDEKNKTSARSFILKMILPDGSIYDMDIVETNDGRPAEEGHKHEGAVVGGTGKYAGIRGTYALEILPGGTSTKITRTYRLDR